MRRTRQILSIKVGDFRVGGGELFFCLGLPFLLPLFLKNVLIV